MNQITSLREFDGMALRPSVRPGTKIFPNDYQANCAGLFFRAIAGDVAALKWCRDNGLIEAKAANESVNAQGAVLVPNEIAIPIIRLREEYATFRRNARVTPMASDLATVPRRATDFSATWLTEGVALTSSQGSLSGIGLVAKKLGVLTTCSSELLEDSIALAEWLSAEFAYAMAKAEDEAAFFGDGSPTYGGITGLRKIFNDGVGSLAGAVDAASGHDTMQEIDAADIASLIARLPAYAQANARWYVSPVMFGHVFTRLAQSFGGLLSRNVNGRNETVFAGYPVEITPATLSPATATTDASDVAMILLGDLSLAAVLGDTRELTIARSDAPKFAEGQVYFKGTERVDINCHGLGDTTNPGAVVALMGE